VSINPPTDIILDVARAADPIKSLAVTERLARLAGVAPLSNPGFAQALGGLGPSSADLLSQLEFSSAPPAPANAPLDARGKAYKGLEELVLRNLVETMLPKDAEAVFGAGTAGDIWKSMLADQLAAQLSKNIDLGLAKAAAARGHSEAPTPAGTHPINASDAALDSYP
jgi:hypothetical protein